MNENIEQKQEDAFGMMFDKLNKTLEEINRQNIVRLEIRDTETNSIQNNRQPETQTRRKISKITKERENTFTKPPLLFYKQLTSMSLNEKTQKEQNTSSGSAPTTIRPFDCTDPAYTVEEYLNSIVATMIFSSGIEPVEKPGHHQWKVKRAALILNTLQGQLKNGIQLYRVKPNLIGKYSVKNFRICSIQKNQDNKQKEYYTNYKNIQMNHYDH